MMAALFDLRGLSLKYPCVYCGAGAGQRCKTVSGQRASYPHDMRTSPVFQGYFVGREEGQRDIIRALDSGDTRYIEARRRRLNILLEET